MHRPQSLAAKKVPPKEELRRLKSAIEHAIEHASGETTKDTRARCFVATISGAVSNICGEEEGAKLFGLLKVVA